MTWMAGLQNISRTTKLVLGEVIRVAVIYDKASLGTRERRKFGHKLTKDPDSTQRVRVWRKLVSDPWSLVGERRFHTNLVITNLKLLFSN